MLQVTETGIYESGTMTTTGNTSNVVTQFNYWWPDGTAYQPLYWNSYPIYVCTDKTAKAIAVLKALEADGVTKITSVSKFIALVEKIAGLL